MLAIHATIVFLSSLLPCAYSHGHLAKPVPRNVLMCPDSDFNRCAADVAVAKSGKETDFGEGAVPDPVCGAGRDSNWFKKGLPQETYTAGDTIDVEWKTVANHGGYYAYRLCLDGSDTEACFKQNYLKNDQGEVWMAVPQNSPNGAYSLKDRIRIPDGISCDQCTLSWRWDTHTKQKNTKVGDAAMIRVNCADIRIRGNPKYEALKADHDPTKCQHAWGDKDAGCCAGSNSSEMPGSCADGFQRIVVGVCGYGNAWCDAHGCEKIMCIPSSEPKTVHDGSKCADQNNDCCASGWFEEKACLEGYIPVEDPQCQYTSNAGCAQLKNGIGCYSCLPPQGLTSALLSATRPEAAPPSFMFIVVALSVVGVMAGR